MENHNFENQGTFNREMNSRHLQMLSIGGVIGTGLFLSSGLPLHRLVHLELLQPIFSELLWSIWLCFLWVNCRWQCR